MKCKIITIPFREDLEGFATKDLESFVADKKVRTMKATSFRQGGRVYWSVFVGYEAGDSARRSKPGAEQQQEAQELTEEQGLLFRTLKEWRKERAGADGLPVYVIATNRQLIQVVLTRPSSLEGLKEIDGLGDGKVGKYGAEILELLKR